MKNGLMLLCLFLVGCECNKSDAPQPDASDVGECSHVEEPFCDKASVVVPINSNLF